MTDQKILLDKRAADRRVAGLRLRSLREAKGLSRQVFAKRLGVDRSALVAWEAGRYAPRADRLTAIAAVLGVSRDELIGTTHRGRRTARGKPAASMIDTIDELPDALMELTRKAKLLRAFRLAAPYPTAAYVQTEWRNLVAQRIESGAMEVQRVEIVYGLPRLKEIVSNIIRYSGLKYTAKVYCNGTPEVVPAMGGYMFDNREFLLGAYWTGLPPTNKPGLRMASEPFTSFFGAYWSEIWSRGTPVNLRGRHDLSKVHEIAVELGLDGARWQDFVEEARTLEIGDGAPPLI